LRTYTTLLEILQDDLVKSTRATANMGEVELTNKTLVASPRVLPALRVYSCWLYQNYQLLFGLKGDPSLAASIESFWKSYGRTLDLVASNFSIWELENYSPVPYMLEEDVGTLGFEPLIDRSGGKANKVWKHLPSGILKSRFSDHDITRLSPNEEMLCRVYGFLEDGLYFAHDLDESPIKIKGDRVFYGNGDEIEQLLMPVTLKKPATKATPKPRPAPANKPLSYAKAAANGKAQVSKPAAPPSRAPAFTQSQSQGTQDAQLSRMVDDLVEEDEAKDPVTPPQQFSTNPTVVQTNGESAIEATPDLSRANGAGYQQNSRSSSKYASVSSLWPTSPVVPATLSPRMPTKFPVGSLASPPLDRGHSRVGSVNSVRSRTSQNVGDSWSSLEGLPQGTGMAQAQAGNIANLPGLGGAYGDGQLLFGAGGGMWSSGMGGRKSFGGVSQDGGFGG
jgi:hypothetical protein